MARISEEEIERLKVEISVERLAEARGVSLTKAGADLRGRCPFHDDKTPSLVITPSKNLWHCLGACQTGGSAIDWVMKSEGVSFRHAVELLRKDALVASTTRSRTESETHRPPPKHSLKRKLEPIASRDADDTELLERVARIYHLALAEAPEACGYLRDRGLTHPEVYRTFHLGYANRTLGYRLAHSQTKAGGAMRQRLAQLGVYRESGHEHLSGSLVIPLFDEVGHVVQLYGRKVNDDLRPGTPKHLYLPGPHRGVFNRAGLEGQEEVILCEALIDALTFWCAGYRHVTSGYGVEGVTEEVLEAIQKSGARRVKIAFDRDDAGEAGAAKVSARLAALGIESYRVLFPRGMDANAYALMVQPAEKSLGIALNKAIWMEGGVVRVERELVDEMTGEVLEEPPVALELATQSEEDEEAAKGKNDVAVAHAIENAPSATTEEIEDEEELVGHESARDDEAEEKSRDEETKIPFLVASPPLPAPSAQTTPRSEASLEPSATALPHEVEPVEEGDEVVFRFARRTWRLRPISKVTQAAELRCNVLVSSAGAGFFVDTLELYSARARASFLRSMVDEVSVSEAEVKTELGCILLAMEKRREEKAVSLASPKSTVMVLTEDEREAAMALLKDPRLLERVLEDLDAAGVVGEETNKLVSYLAATSRKLDAPLAVVIQSSSAAGKSSLMESVLALMPDEERVQYSAMTGQSLFYMGGVDLRHKVLAIVEEEGAERANYALKLLQSEGELTIASTGKDAATGRLMTHTYRVEGPVMIFLTTTSVEVDEELLNRCLVLAVDEAREQTRAIHVRQRRAQSLEGRSLSAGRSAIRKLHQNAQRLLRPVVVVNPFAEALVFPDHATRTRRDHMKYLTLINAVTLLHQHQRPLKSAEVRGGRLEYIEVTRADVEIATRLARAVLFRGLDELPPQTRRMLEAVQAMVKEKALALGVSAREARFTRREVRERTHLSKEQVRIHMTRLLELEYVFPHRGRMGQSFEYELAYTEDVSVAFDVGLPRTTDNRPGGNANRPGLSPNRPGGDRGGVRSVEASISANETRSNGALTGAAASAHLEPLAIGS